MDAKKGDLCVMIENSNHQHPAEWLEQLQRKLGGVCTARPHVTCQRLYIEEPAARDKFCLALKPALRHLKKFAVYGDGLTLRYSQFRSCWILKCHSPLSSPLREAFATIDRVALKNGAILAHGRGEDFVPVTVLENIPTAKRSQEQVSLAGLSPGTKLFDAERVTISMLGDPGNFSFVDAWPI